MSSNLSVIRLAFHHSIVVQLVLLCLLALSLASWTVILQKWAVLRADRRALRDLTPRLRSATDVPSALHRAKGPTSRLERLLATGFERVARMRGSVGPDGGESRQDVRELWESAIWREVRRLDSNLPFLATVGSLSPYIGLFGTVWGIIGAMGALGDAHEMSLASVAPGIAEALVATAAGLFAAIPALVAHNHFASNIDGLADDYLALVEEFGLGWVSGSPMAGAAEASRLSHRTACGGRLGREAP